MNKIQLEKAKARKPIERLLKGITQKYGTDLAFSAMRHYLSVAAVERKTAKQIAELQARLAKLKK